MTASTRRQFCAWLAVADASMSSAPERAWSAAEAAGTAWPGQAAAEVAKARAHLRLGRVSDSIAAFDRGLAVDPRCADAPEILRDLPTARRIAGDARGALVAYRRLLPLGGLLPGASRRTRVMLEAAHTAMRASLEPQAAPAAHDAPSTRAEETEVEPLREARDILREAARDAGDLRVDVALSLALVLDRIGSSDQADAILAGTRASAAWARAPEVGYLGDPADRDAMRALALERNSPADAATALRKYLATVSPSHRYRLAAERRLERLASRPKASPSSGGR